MAGFKRDDAHRVSVLVWHVGAGAPVITQHRIARWCDVYHSYKTQRSTTKRCLCLADESLVTLVLRLSEAVKRSSSNFNDGAQLVLDGRIRLAQVAPLCAYPVCRLLSRKTRGVNRASRHVSRHRVVGIVCPHSCRKFHPGQKTLQTGLSLSADTFVNDRLSPARKTLEAKRAVSR